MNVYTSSDINSIKEDLLPKLKQTKRFCELHDNKYSAFCCEEGSLLCYECFFSQDHENHEILSIDKAVEREKSFFLEIKSINSQLNKKSALLLSESTNFLNQFIKSANHSRESVYNFFEIIKSKILEAEEIIEDLYQRFIDDKKNKFTEQIEMSSNIIEELKILNFMNFGKNGDEIDILKNSISRRQVFSNSKRVLEPIQVDYEMPKFNQKSILETLWKVIREELGIEKPIGIHKKKKTLSEKYKEVFFSNKSVNAEFHKTIKKGSFSNLDFKRGSHYGIGNRNSNYETKKTQNSSSREFSSKRENFKKRASTLGDGSDFIDNLKIKKEEDCKGEDYNLSNKYDIENFIGNQSLEYKNNPSIQITNRSPENSLKESTNIENALLPRASRIQSILIEKRLQTDNDKNLQNLKIRRKNNNHVAKVNSLIQPLFCYSKNSKTFQTPSKISKSQDDCESITTYVGNISDDTLEIFSYKTKESYDIIKMSQSIKSASLIQFNGQIIIFGGILNNTVSDCCFGYDLKSNTWSSKKLNLLRGKFNITTVLCKNQIYLIGGQDSDGAVLSEVEVIDTQSLRRVNHFYLEKETVFSSGLVSKQSSTIYLFGGMNSFMEITAECLFLTSKNDTINLPFMFTQRIGCSVLERENKFYVFGGFDGSNYLNSVEVFSTEINKWELHTFMLNPKAFFAIDYYEKEDTLFLFGGRNEKKLSDVHSYCFSTGDWREEKKLKLSRESQMIFKIN